MPVTSNIPQNQQLIRGKCFHRTGAFLEFPREEVEGSIPARFDKIVRKYPDRIAIRSREIELTYGELNALANGIACGLSEKQKGEEYPVALLLEPSHLAIAAVMGVLKARRIYVPLDPSYPKARLLSVLDNSGARVILTDEKNIGLANDLSLGGRLCLRAEEMNAADATTSSVSIVSPNDPVAIFFTSGSTGEPKGVVQNHRSVLHRVMTDTNDFHICAEDRLSLLSSPCYSVSLRNLFGALLNGAAVCPFDVAKEGFHNLETWLRSERITIYFSVPSVFRQLVGNLRDHASWEFLRLIYLAGESMTNEDAQLYQNYFSEAILVNSLASNEAGIIAQYFMDKDFEISEARVSAGFPVNGKKLLILGEDGNEIGMGSTGEIAVQSKFLSPGYWQNGRLTRLDLTPDSEGIGIAIFRTGDLGYLREDGCLIHLGRKGSRVKIRGSRVELEEVEAVLRKHNAVREVVLDSFGGEFGGGQLVAYVVLYEGQRVTITELRDDLAAKLPDFMIPASFVFLEALPLTPNGKIDRRALPFPDKSRPQLKAGFAPPTTADEVLLVEMWSKILSVDQIGVRDNFFELGGNSLLAAVLMDRINRVFHKSLSIATAYENPTVETFAKTLNDERASDASSSLINLQPSGSKPPLFWIHGQASDSLIGKYFMPDRPIYGLIHQSMDGKVAAYTTVESIAAHYLRQIRMVQSRGPYLLGGYCFGGLVAFEMAQQLKKVNEEISMLLLLDPPNIIASSSTTTGFKPGLKKTSIGSRAFAVHIGRSQKVIHIFRDMKEVIKVVARSLANRVIRLMRHLVIHTFLKFGKPIPVRLRSAYILDVYERAMRGYWPTVYPGRLCIFQAADGKRNPESWSHLATKGVEIEVIPGNHENVLREPYLAGWIEKLKSQICR